MATFQSCVVSTFAVTQKIREMSNATEIGPAKRSPTEFLKLVPLRATISAPLFYFFRR